jgi:hypothetical protein
VAYLYLLFCGISSGVAVGVLVVEVLLRREKVFVVSEIWLIIHVVLEERVSVWLLCAVHQLIEVEITKRDLFQVNQTRPKGQCPHVSILLANLRSQRGQIFLCTGLHLVLSVAETLQVALNLC